jgi:hypothetical protein
MACGSNCSETEAGLFSIRTATAIAIGCRIVDPPGRGVGKAAQSLLLEGHATRSLSQLGPATIRVGAFHRPCQRGSQADGTAWSPARAGGSGARICGRQLRHRRAPARFKSPVSVIVQYLTPPAERPKRQAKPQGEGGEAPGETEEVSRSAQGRWRAGKGSGRRRANQQRGR